MNAGERFARLSTPLIADAAMRIGLDLRLAPSGLAPVHAEARMAGGRVAPARHVGSVDVFLEAIEKASPGDVLVIDNDGRRDEGCIGDLTVLEATAAGLAGLVVWGLHRDTAELRRIAMPVFTYGTFPAGPRRLDPDDGKFMFGDVAFSRDDYVFADDDGAIFIDSANVSRVLDVAESIAHTERLQAQSIRDGRSLRTQLRFTEYLDARQSDESLTFRRHLAKIGGAIEV